MENLEGLIHSLGLVVIAAPSMAVVVLGAASLLSLSFTESTIDRIVRLAVLIGLAASAAILAIMGWHHDPQVIVPLGDWVLVPEYHYAFSFRLVFDRLSVPFVILSFVLCGTIGAFASRYMHRESGYNRFYVLYAIFVLGMTLAALAGTIETLFTGWELVGLSSALLVAFYQERPAPPRNGLHVWAIYRVSDAALLLAAIALHHWVPGHGDLAQFGGEGVWPEETIAISQGQAFLIGSLFLIAAAGKSALAPFSGWLPRAMEGPTPSSAVFYGALSVHLGAYLLLRVCPLLDASIWLEVFVVALGLVTAVLASLVSSVQTDIKSALSYASLAQVGIIVAEIGFGLRFIALIHLLGHACLRTLQFVRAPMLLQDLRGLENALGERVPRPATWWGGLVPPSVQSWLYRFSLERCYFDAFLLDYIVAPFQTMFRRMDHLERRWTELIAGQSPVESEPSDFTPEPNQER
ncbi:MAG: proton-conducting transporter membrane subunit [Gemmataceae bacterium]